MDRGSYTLEKQKSWMLELCCCEMSAYIGGRGWRQKWGVSSMHQEMPSRTREKFLYFPPSSLQKKWEIAPFLPIKFESIISGEFESQGIWKFYIAWSTGSWVKRFTASFFLQRLQTLIYSSACNILELVNRLLDLHCEAFHFHQYLPSCKAFCCKPTRSRRISSLTSSFRWGGAASKMQLSGLCSKWSNCSSW